MNKLKTKIIQVRRENKLRKIYEYIIKEEVQYLDIKIVGRWRNIFQAENKTWLEKVEKKANELIPQIRKSFDKVVVRKVIWKLMSIPGILFGRSVVVTPRSTVEKVQRIENKVWRYLLGIGGYSTVESLRGEIGSSLILRE